MKYFISFMMPNRNALFPSTIPRDQWIPENAIIDQHPLEWLRSYPGYKLIFWSKIPSNLL